MVFSQQPFPFTTKASVTFPNCYLWGETASRNYTAMQLSNTVRAVRSASDT